MNKTCPLSSLNNSNSVKECGDKCVLYEDGCLIKKALKCYIKAQETLTQQPITYLHSCYPDKEDQSYLPL